MGYSVEALFSAQNRISETVTAINRSLSGMATQATTTRTALEKMQAQHDTLALKIKQTATAMADAASGGKVSEAQWERLNMTLRNTSGQLADVEAKMRAASKGPSMLDSLFGGGKGLAGLFGGTVLGAGGGGIVNQLIGSISGGLPAIGATIGTLFGPVGTAIGGLLGGAGSAVTGLVGTVGNALGGLANLALSPLRLIADTVTGVVGGAFSALGGVIQNTLGGLLSAAVQGGISLLSNMAGKSVSATAGFQTMQVGMEGLLAREMSRGTVVEKTRQVAITLTDKETKELAKQETQYNKLSTSLASYMADLPVAQERLNKMISGHKASAAEIYHEQTNIAQLKAKIEDTRNAMSESTAVQEKLVGKTGQYATVVDRVATGQMDMADALKMASGPAKVLMEQLADIAMLSPFESKDVTEMFRTAMVYDRTSDAATGMTKAMLNQAAALGMGSAELGRYSYNLLNMSMQGQVMKTDVRQLGMLGVDLNDIFAFIGKTMKSNVTDYESWNAALEAGTVTWKDFDKYFIQYSEKNFAGASERMSRTIEGLQSTMSDVFTLTMPKVLGPAAEQVTGFLNRILTAFMGIRSSGVLEALGEQIGGWTSKLLAGVTEGPLGKALTYVEKYFDLMSKYNKAAPVAKTGRMDRFAAGEAPDLRGELMSQIQAMTGGGDFITGLLTTIFGATDTAKIMAVVTPLLQGNFAPLGAAIADTFNSTVMPALKDTGGKIWDALFSVGGLTDKAGGFLVKVLDSITNVIANPDKELMSTLGAAGGTFGDAITRFLFGGEKKGVGPDERGKAGGAWDAVVRLATQIMDNLNAWIKDEKTIAAFTSFWGSFRDTLSSAISKVDFSPVVNALGSALVKAIWNNSPIVAAVNAAIGAVKGIQENAGTVPTVPVNPVTGLPESGSDYTGTRALGGSVFPRFPRALATGGYAGPYVLGENGPELFWPGVAGMIESNSSYRQYNDNRKTEYNIGDAVALQMAKDRHRRDDLARAARRMD